MIISHKNIKYNSINLDPYGAHMKLINLAGSGNKILELGCSSGCLSKKLKENNNAIIGVEIDKKAAELAKRYCEKVYVEDLDNLNLSFDKDEFDVIILADILEHLKYSDKILPILKKFLKKEGYLLISVPNVANWKIRLKLLRGVFTYTNYGILDKTHLRFFTLKTIKENLQDQGYIINHLDVTPGIYTPHICNRLKLPNRLSYYLSRLFKTLFGFQFIIKAKKK